MSIIPNAHESLCIEDFPLPCEPSQGRRSTEGNLCSDHGEMRRWRPGEMGVGTATESCPWCLGGEPREAAEPQVCVPRQYLEVGGSEQPQDGAGVCGGEELEHSEREPLISFLVALAASFHFCIRTFPCPPGLNSPSRPHSVKVCLFLFSTCFKRNLL